MNDARKGSGTRSQNVYPIGKNNPNLPIGSHARSNRAITAARRDALDCPKKRSLPA
jgi:hypothetical protein